MDSTKFDAATRRLTALATRRGVVRGLAAGAFAAATGGVLLRDAAARPSAERRKKPKKGKTCKPGKAVTTVSVPANGSAVTTPVLKTGQRYRLRATGFWSTNAQFGNDAFAAFPFANPNQPEKVFEGVRLGLAVDGDSPDQWGSYTTSHEYERTIVGAGRALSLRFTDPITTDNSGSLSVQILCD